MSSILSPRRVGSDLSCTEQNNVEHLILSLLALASFVTEGSHWQRPGSRMRLCKRLPCCPSVGRKERQIPDPYCAVCQPGSVSERKLMVIASVCLTRSCLSLDCLIWRCFRLVCLIRHCPSLVRLIRHCLSLVRLIRHCLYWSVLSEAASFWSVLSEVASFWSVLCDAASVWSVLYDTVSIWSVLSVTALVYFIWELSRQRSLCRRATEVKRQRSCWTHRAAF